MNIMKISFIIFLLCSIACIFTQSVDYPATSGLQENAAWPTFRRNTYGLGSSPFGVSNDIQSVKWKREIGYSISLSPIIGADDVIYI